MNLSFFYNPTNHTGGEEIDTSKKSVDHTWHFYSGQVHFRRYNQLLSSFVQSCGMRLFILRQRNLVLHGKKITGVPTPVFNN